MNRKSASSKIKIKVHSYDEEERLFRNLMATGSVVFLLWQGSNNYIGWGGG